MADELESRRLLVVLFPAPNPAFIGHMVRSTVETNAAWYRAFCYRHPGKNRYTRIKRRNTVNVLRSLSEGKRSKSIYADEFKAIAEKEYVNADPF